MKKVLVIVYYWPPSGGAGVQRWLKFVKYLPQFGWQPTVITTKDGDYPAIDESLQNEVPEIAKIIRTKTPTFGKFFFGKNNLPYGSLETNREDSIFRKISIWIRLNLIFPDARKVWNKYALQAAEQELRSDHYDAMITSGPPHSTHLVGLKLKKKFGIKWLADFRDPWTKIDYLEKVHRSDCMQKWDKKLETKVIESCDKVIGISRKILHDLKIHSKGAVIPNGFDAADFKDIQPEKPQYFEINYFGNIIAERNPILVLEAVNQILIKNREIAIKFNFWGNVSEKIRTELEKTDPFRIVTFHDYISHRDVLKKMVSSALLLLLINNVPDNRGILTGKIFEYLGAGIPILGIGPKDGEAAEILQRTKAGKMFDYEDLQAVSEFILEIYRQWQKGEYRFLPVNISEFDRINLTGKMTEILAN